MDVQKVLGELRAYKALLDDAITAFDRLAHRRGETRGRLLHLPAAPRSSAAAKKRKRRAVGRKKASS